MNCPSYYQNYIVRGIFISYLVGENRYQGSIIPRSLDEMIDENNAVRVIDAFVDSVDLNKFGFRIYEATNRDQRPYKNERHHIYRVEYYLNDEKLSKTVNFSRRVLVVKKY